MDVAPLVLFHTLGQELLQVILQHGLTAALNPYDPRATFDPLAPCRQMPPDFQPGLQVICEVVQEP